MKEGAEGGATTATPHHGNSSVTERLARGDAEFSISMCHLVVFESVYMGMKRIFFF